MAVLFLLASSLSACNAHKKPSWEDDKAAVNEAIQSLESEQKKEAQNSEAKLAAMQLRLQELEAVVERQHSTIENLTAKVEEHERIEEERRVEEQKRLERQRRIAEQKRLEERKRLAEQKRIEKRQRLLEQQRLEEQKRQADRSLAQAQQAAGAAKPEQTNGTTNDPSAEVAVVEENEKNTYTAAYLAYKSGRLDEAAKGFNKQLDLYPKGEYVDQAWYWLGETRYAQHGYTLAMNAFKHIADHYPESGKHAAARLRLGKILQALDRDREAKKYYARLLNEHADSEAAEQARAALAEYKIKDAGNKERQQ